MNLESICAYCKKAKKCTILASLFAGLEKGKSSLSATVSADIVVTQCEKFKPSHAEKQVRHICYSCKKSINCSLWEQVCNIDEDFVRNAFEYDPDEQEVCSTVSRCKLYEPK